MLCCGNFYFPEKGKSISGRWLFLLHHFWAFQQSDRILTGGIHNIHVIARMFSCFFLIRLSFSRWRSNERFDLVLLLRVTSWIFNEMEGEDRTHGNLEMGAVAGQPQSFLDFRKTWSIFDGQCTNEKSFEKQKFEMDGHLFSCLETWLHSRSLRHRNLTQWVVHLGFLWFMRREYYETPDGEQNEHFPSK